MGKIIVHGGKRLSGEIRVDGSKNAALPILFATIATGGISRIDGLPDILDVRTTLRILEALGAGIRKENNSVLIDTGKLAYRSVPSELTRSLRASTYLIGSCLVRFHKVDILDYGGCCFGVRPIDMHIRAAEALGAVYNGASITVGELTPNVIKFDKISVGATVNALIMCAGTHGESIIYGFAREPHVFSLIDFLTSAGADIKVYDDRISVFGGELSGSYSHIIPDMIEAGTYLALSVATNSDITVLGADSRDLSSFISFLSSSGITFEIGERTMRARGSLERFSELFTGPYPEFPTDLQPVIAPLFSAFSGGSITDRVWSDRFAYLTELSKFGVKYSRFPSGAFIYPSALTPARVTATDLRGGAALLIAALTSKGESAVDRAELIGRGYSNITSKLSNIGADVKEIN